MAGYDFIGEKKKAPSKNPFMDVSKVDYIGKTKKVNKGGKFI